MKEDFLRLLSAAMDYYPTRVRSPADLARFLNESDQTIHNWSKRGLPKTKVFDLAIKVGCNGIWLRDGTGPKSAASLKTVMDALDRTEEDQESDRKSNLSQKLPFDDGYKPATPLMSEIQSRDIPPHIEQAIMALLQTCKTREENQTVDTYIEAARKAFDRLLDSMPPDEKYEFIGFREQYLSGGGRGVVSPKVYESGSAAPSQAGDDQKKQSGAR